MGREINSDKCSGKVTCEIRMKLPSLNDYVDICRKNHYQANNYKKDIEYGIMAYTRDIPHFTRPIYVHFHWIEDNRRRDLDNVCFAKKFILDALVRAGKIDDDSWRYVKGFQDTFSYGKQAGVILYITEEDENGKKTTG